METTSSPWAPIRTSPMERQAYRKRTRMLHRWGISSATPLRLTVCVLHGDAVAPWMFVVTRPYRRVQSEQFRPLVHYAKKQKNGLASLRRVALGIQQGSPQSQLYAVEPIDFQSPQLFHAGLDDGGEGTLHCFEGDRPVSKAEGLSNFMVAVALGSEEDGKRISAGGLQRSLVSAPSIPGACFPGPCFRAHACSL